MPSVPGTEDALNFTFTVAIILTFLFVIHVAFGLFKPYYICKQHYGKNVVVYHLITFFQDKNSQFYTFFQPIFRHFLTLFQLFDDIINQKSLSARVCRKAQHFIGTLQYF